MCEVELKNLSNNNGGVLGMTKKSGVKAYEMHWQ